jgi:hypothetical protein
LLSKEVFTSWIELMRKLLDRPVPEVRVYILAIAIAEVARFEINCYV